MWNGGSTGGFSTRRIVDAVADHTDRVVAIECPWSLEGSDHAAAEEKGHHESQKCAWHGPNEN
jgi:hypothetical protein